MNKNINVNEVISFLEDAQSKTFSLEDRCRLSQAANTLYNMKICGCFKN